MYKLTIKIHYLDYIYDLLCEREYDIFSIKYNNISKLGKRIKKSKKFYDILYSALNNAYKYPYSAIQNDIHILFGYRWPSLNDIKRIIQKIPDSKILDSLHQIFLKGDFYERVIVDMYIRKNIQGYLDFNTRLEYLVNNK